MDQYFYMLLCHAKWQLEREEDEEGEGEEDNQCSS